MVEGPDDKRLFYARVRDPAQVLATGGRTLLLSAYRSASDPDRKQILFFTDCDYAVRRGELHGGDALVITAGTTVESDILALGALVPIVTEVVPSALAANRVAEVCAEVMRLAIALTLPLGRIRMATQSLGVDLGLQALDFAKYCDAKAESFKTNKLLKVISAKLRQPGIASVNLAELLSTVPTDDGMCNGKDMVRAIRFVLHRRFKVTNEITDGVLSRMLRLSLDSRAFEGWSVVRRIRGWEKKTGRIILTPTDTAAS